MADGKESAASTPFLLKNAGQGFEGRSCSVFGGLDALEQQHMAHEKNRTDLDDFADLRPDDVKNSTTPGSSDADVKLDKLECRGDRDRNRITQDRAEDTRMRRDRDRDHVTPDRAEEIRARRDRDSARQVEEDGRFPRPRRRPPARRQRVPDHGKGPHKWTYYSLEDVQGADLSDKANTQTALAFLEERRKLREEEERANMEEEEYNFDSGAAACSKGLFSFSKRNKVEKTDGGSSNPTKLDDRVVELPICDQSAETGDDMEQGEEGEKRAAVSETSTQETGPVKPSFKSRKGIKRSIRSRDDGD